MKKIDLLLNITPEMNACTNTVFPCHFENRFTCIKKNRVVVLFWYRKAAEQGYAPAQTNLGWLYFNGYEGVAPNRAVAVHWFSEAAAQGNRAAVRNLQALGEEIPGQGGS